MGAALMAACVQPVGMKIPAPSPVSGLCERGARAEGGPYVHTPIGTSSPKHFHGSTSDTVEKIRKKKRFKHIAECAHALFEAGEEDASKALLSCGRYFRKWKSKKCGTVRLVPCPCESPFCPECANRRSLPLQERICELLNKTEHDYFHMVITVLNWLTLTKPALQKMISQFAELRETEEWREEVTGGIYSVEATYNREVETWHPHFHVLIETRKRLPLAWIESIKMRWREITGDSHVIHLEPMYGVDKKGRKTRKINRRAVRELVKYATKTADFSDHQDCVLDFFHAFKGIRRMQSFGSFLGVVKQADKEANESHVKEPVGCSCGLCKWNDGYFELELVHISQTILLADGSRQLKLFESGMSPPDFSVLDEVPEKEYQKKQIGRMQPLLFVGPLFDGPYESI